MDSELVRYAISCVLFLGVLLIGVVVVLFSVACIVGIIASYPLVGIILVIFAIVLWIRSKA